MPKPTGTPTRPPPAYKRHICQKLAGGIKREPFGHGLPPHIKLGLRWIAYREAKSMSRVMEEVIIEHFNLAPPEYVESAQKGPDATPQEKLRSRTDRGGVPKLVKKRRAVA